MRGLSMNTVAECAGLSQQMVSNVERGLRKPTFDTLLRIAMTLEITLRAFVASAERPGQAKRR
jgi:transcriptional regulator with XRE-family HTH domain